MQLHISNCSSLPTQRLSRCFKPLLATAAPRTCCSWPPAPRQVIDEGATLAASFVERALPKIDLTHEMEADTGAIMQKGVHKVSCV